MDKEKKMEVEVKIKLPEIEGFEYTGEFRSPRRGEYYLNTVRNTGEQASFTYGSIRKHILKKKQSPKDWVGKLCSFREYAVDELSFICTLHKYKEDSDFPFVVEIGDAEFLHCAKCRPLTREEVEELIYEG